MKVHVTIQSQEELTSFVEKGVRLALGVCPVDQLEVNFAGFKDRVFLVMRNTPTDHKTVVDTVWATQEQANGRQQDLVTQNMDSLVCTCLLSGLEAAAGVSPQKK